MTCRRCGTNVTRLTPDQRYCSPCLRELDAILAPKPKPDFVPAWRKRDLTRDETRLVSA
jgi:hypothetical protein